MNVQTEEKGKDTRPTNRGILHPQKQKRGSHVFRNRNKEKRPRNPVQKKSGKDRHTRNSAARPRTKKEKKKLGNVGPNPEKALCAAIKKEGRYGKGRYVDFTSEPEIAGRITDHIKKREAIVQEKENTRDREDYVSPPLEKLRHG